MDFSVPVVSFIPTSVQVIACTLTNATTTTTTTSPKWRQRPHHNNINNNIVYNIYNNQDGEEPSSSSLSSPMDDLAEDVLNCLRSNLTKDNNNYFLYHGFSNGGCFLWEHLRTMMDDDDTFDDNTTTTITTTTNTSSHFNIQSRLWGVVFDSCPAWFEDVRGIQIALDHRTPNKRQAILTKFWALMMEPSSSSSLQTTPRQQCQDLLAFLLKTIRSLRVFRNCICILEMTNRPIPNAFGNFWANDD
jgi:hypothetical protein